MFELNIDTQALVQELTAMQRNQLPFAWALAANRTMEEAQLAAMREIDDTFTLRRRTFILRMVKIAPEDRATKTRLTAGIRIEGPRARPDRAKVLTRHEAGGPRVASQSPFFVPTRALRPTASASIAQAMYPSFLRVVTTRVGDSGRFREPTLSNRGPLGTQHVRGARRTFVLDPALGHRISPRAAGIYQRVGPGRSGIVRLWAYRPSITLEPSLRFQATFERVVADRFNDNFTGALAYALDEQRQDASSRGWRIARVAGFRPPSATEIIG